MRQLLVFLMFLSGTASAQYANPRLPTPNPGPYVDLYGNVYQRTSPNVVIINGRAVYRSTSGYVGPRGFLHDADPRPRYNPYNINNRMIVRPPSRHTHPNQYRDHMRRSVERYRATLPRQYRGDTLYRP